jgi:hypothetical protein
LEKVAKFRGRQEQLKKALGNGTLAAIDHNLLAPLLGFSKQGGVCFGDAKTFHDMQKATAALSG